MGRGRLLPALSRLLSDYGMVVVLGLLCVYYSLVTISEQPATGRPGGRQLATAIAQRFRPPAAVLLVGRDQAEDRAFIEAARETLVAKGFSIAGVVLGQPPDARKTLEQLAARGQPLAAIGCNQVTGTWRVFENLPARYPALGQPQLIVPRPYRWPNFLKTDNLLNIANQIVVIAIIAIGMTMVIITAGIDLSVGSLIALSAVVTTLFIRDLAGGPEAGPLAQVLCCLGGMMVCALVGLVSGIMVAVFGIPAFIATLAMMLVASGLAYIFAEGQSIYQVPDSFIWLGRGADLGLPNAVVLMILLYVAAHVLMTRTALGRYIYAVGGNLEAAHLSGVPVRRVLLFVYTLCGMLAGLGGVVMASQLKSGAPTYGQMYELYVIAAVVVGGTSLAGGEGKVLGTLIGAFIIAVIQNGMNLTGVESYTQKVVLGLVILGAVLLDMVRRRSVFQPFKRWWTQRGVTATQTAMEGTHEGPSAESG